MTEEKQLSTDALNVTAVCWQGDFDMDFDQWSAVGSTLQQFDRSLPWWVGDWLNFGEMKYGETYAQAIEETGMRVERLKNYKWVAAAIDADIRVDPAILSWSAHRLVAPFEPHVQKHWLEMAVENGWDSAQLRHKLTAAFGEPDDGDAAGMQQVVSQVYEFLDECDKLLKRAGFPGASTEDGIVERLRELVDEHSHVNERLDDYVQTYEP